MFFIGKMVTFGLDDPHGPFWLWLARIPNCDGADSYPTPFLSPHAELSNVVEITVREGVPLREWVSGICQGSSPRSIQGHQEESHQANEIS